MTGRKHKPKIVVLDGYTLNPGDLSWRDLETLGDCDIHDHTATNDAAVRAHGVEILLTNKTPVTRPLIRVLPTLKYIGVIATGYNVVDTDAAKERGIPVTNVPVYAAESVAQQVFAHLLNLTHHVADHSRTVREGKWSATPHFCYWDFPLIELRGLTMGIVGFGRIGRAVARIAASFGMKVAACDVRAVRKAPRGVRMTDMDAVFRAADVVTLHCPLTPENRGFVNAERLAMMKPGAFLINTARGALIDEAALADALNCGGLAGAGLDVLSVEPPGGDNPVLGAKNCFVTPHIGWATRAARRRLLKEVVANVKAFLAGRPRNVVNGVASG